MAKKRPLNPSTLRKLTSFDAAETNRLTYRELQKIVSPLRKEAARRQDIIEKAGVFSPALESFKESGVSFRAKKNASRNQLLGQYVELRKFLGDKTSTITGTKKVIAERNRMIGGRLPKDLEKLYWDAWNRFKEIPGNYVKESGKEKGETAKKDMKNLRNIILSGKNDFAEIVATLKSMQQSDYEIMEAARNEDEGYSALL